MARRRKLKSNWPPPGWDVKTEWNVNGTLVKSRQHDVQVRTAGRATTWVMFDYLVHNTNNDKHWVSGFSDCGFVAYRPEQVIAARIHRVKRKRNADQHSEPSRAPQKRGRDKTKKS